MNVIALTSLAVSGFVVTALLAAVVSFHKPLSGFIAGIGGAGASLCTLLVGFQLLTGLAAQQDGLLFGTMTITLTALNAVWLIALALPGLFISLFNISWHRQRTVAANGLPINLLLAAALLAIVADNLAMLVVMAEIMALCGVFLTGDMPSGKLWFVLGRLGTLLLVLVCWQVWQQYGTFSFTQLHMLTITRPLSATLWLLSLAGFGLLAGIIPLHGWVPQAHAKASAPAAALFSAVVMKVGLYGVLITTLASSIVPLWWGMLILVAGMITAFIGGLYALMEHNINRLLAYHTLENIGIILLGFGAGITGVALHEPVLMALGFTGGLYHLINHSLFKSTLLLGAGAVWYRTGLRDIEKLGGIGKRMPVISLAMLTGLMAMAALPPLNGFAGEWVIYQSFFRLGELAPFVTRLAGPLLATGLAITGALAVMCMAKVYGVLFLGAPRTPQAQEAADAPGLLKFCVAALALCCVAGGVAAPWLLPLLHHAVPLPLVTARTQLSQPLITLLLIAAMLLPFLLTMLLRGDRLPARQRGSAWVCGYDHEESMVITAHGFAAPLKTLFAPLLTLRKCLNPSRLIPGWHSATLPQLFRCLAAVELAVLIVVIVSRGV